MPNTADLVKSTTCATKCAKKGYRFNRSEKIAMLPDDSALRSELQERRIMELGYAIQLNMFDQENANK